LNRLLSAFLLAAVLAAAITFFFYRRLGHAPQVRASSQILVAAKDLPVGVALTGSDVMLLDWYSTELPAGAFTKADAVLGRPVLYPLAARQPVLDRDLGVQGAGIGLAGKIPEGMRAIAVRANEISGVAGFLYPGSHVDVMVTYTPPGNKMPETQTVLQNVEVLTAGQTIQPDPQGRPEKVNVVTVLLSPRDSQKLQLASGQGNIQFVLRSGADQTQASVQPIRLDDLFPGNKPPVVAKVVKHTPREPKPIYSLEVIQGTKKTEEKFEDSKNRGISTPER
jgi:pilus assembly protein CpaB